MMTRLSLLRNDPDDARAIFLKARQGDVDAEYGMGLIYAEGRGVPIDNAKAYFWLSQACIQGDAEARLLRNIIARDMTDAEYDQARWMCTQADFIGRIEL